MFKVGLVVGTRPEAIKMAPVIRALRDLPEIETAIIGTGQHRDMLQQALDVFGIALDYSYDVMQAGQSLPQLMAKILQVLDELLSQETWDLLLVHGDTTTAFAAAVAGFYRGIPVGHVEAGLRTPSVFLPFPEEANRRLVDVISSLYFAPTEQTADNLRRIGIAGEQLFVTGNTVIDALFSVLEADYQFQDPALAAVPRDRPWLVATVHRREHWGDTLLDICAAFREAAETLPIAIVFCMHKNPRLQEVLRQELGSRPHIYLVEAPGYKDFAHLMQRSYLVATDSGGLQEEAPALNKPVLVLRETTERPEGLEAGTLKLVGTKKDRVLAGIKNLMHNKKDYQDMAAAVNPYGDGMAARRIADIILKTLNSWREDHGNSAG